MSKQAKEPATQAPADKTVKRPSADSLCGQLWAMFDELGDVPRGVAVQAAIANGINVHTVNTQWNQRLRYLAQTAVQGSKPANEPKRAKAA